ncbi:hypothetical protein PBV87_12770 [Niameybacter massiliensis]|uniref:Uncharacterized protein n=1 Tax=Holtiella tumoricola TaxID=3018743 RepID=A0AA42J1P6_9FIRM|nr:hypothetical protein [Holtiella tumoricola]MDA3732361.1 hypothetical protein [Holtiella tumoricola]
MENERQLTEYEQKEIEAAKLAKQELELSFYSPMFAGIAKDIDRAVKNSTANVYDEEFEEATIAITIKISCEEKEATKTIESGNGSNAKIAVYKAPRIKHRVTAKLVQKDTTDGDVTYTTHELVEEGGKLIAKPLQQAQISIEELEVVDQSEDKEKPESRAQMNVDEVIKNNKDELEA